ncbi:hypothetical protein NPIL_499341, partial [Nephila pilipes]
RALAKARGAGVQRWRYGRPCAYGEAKRQRYTRLRRLRLARFLVNEQSFAVSYTNSDTEMIITGLQQMQEAYGKESLYISSQPTF